MTNPEQTLDAALREARNDALEEAAQVCERHASGVNELWRGAMVNAASRIRALKTQESKS